MSTTTPYHLASRDDILHIHLHGPLGVEATKALVEDLGKTNVNPTRPVLIDCRDTEKDLSYKDAHQVVLVIAEHLEGYTDKLALVNRMWNSLEATQFLCEDAKRYGITCRVFLDDEPARAWVTHDRQPQGFDERRSAG